MKSGPPIAHPMAAEIRERGPEWLYRFCKGRGFIRLLLLGGRLYSVGAVTEYLGWPVVIPGVVQGHEVFHLAILSGAFCHWLFIWLFATVEVRIAERTVPVAGR